MKNLDLEVRDRIRKILKENDFEWISELDSDLPFEVSSTPTNRPKKSNYFKIKTLWSYGDLSLREEFEFNPDRPTSFEWFKNVCRFYNKLLGSRAERWRDVSDLAKSIGLGLGSYDDEEIYGTPKDMSDYVVGTDYPAWLDEVDIYYYDKGGVEYPVNLKD